MVKPIGSACNMACKYCYYLGNDLSRRKPMSYETLDVLIRSYFESSDGDVYSFIWHGGEPTLRGLDFFKQAVALQKKYLPKGKKCWNNLQTNGLSLNEEWCAFLKQEHFDVGFSIDGTKLSHDTYRKDASGNETYERIKENIGLLKRYGIYPDLLCTVNAMTQEDPYGVYKSLQDLHTGWIQFIPVANRREDGSLDEDSIDPLKYGEFLRCIFHQWFYHDTKDTGVQLFMEMLLAYMGKGQTLCWLKKECGDVPVVESDGRVYSCDHFVNERHYLGNIHESSFEKILEKQESFARRKSDLSEKCSKCSFLFLCHGGCIKDRDEEGNNILCQSYLKLFEETKEPMAKAVALMKKGYTLPQAASFLKKERDALWKDIKPNALCPCGSRRKFKHCCRS